MKTEQNTTTIFTLPSGLELRLTNADPRDVEWLSGIERAVTTERERCAKLCDAYESGGQDWAAIAAGELAREIRGF